MFLRVNIYIHTYQSIYTYIYIHLRIPRALNSSEALAANAQARSRALAALTAALRHVPGPEAVWGLGYVPGPEAGD